MAGRLAAAFFVTPCLDVAGVVPVFVAAALLTAVLETPADFATAFVGTAFVVAAFVVADFAAVAFAAVAFVVVDFDCPEDAADFDVVFLDVAAVLAVEDCAAISGSDATIARAVTATATAAIHTARLIAGGACNAGTLRTPLSGT